MLRWFRSGLLAFAVVCTSSPVAEAQDEWGLTRGRGARGTGRGRGRSPAARGRGRGTGRARGTARGRARGTGRARGRGRSAVQATTQPDTGGPAERTDVLIARYLRVLEQDPRETFAFRRLLDLYRQRDGDVEGFTRELRERIETDDAAYAPRMLLGHVLKAQGHVDEARGAYLRAAELRPREAAPQVALARIERSVSDLEGARRHYDVALPLTRERLAREELLREVAAVAMEQREFDAARDYYSQLARGNGGSVYLRTEYARALAAAREWELAVTEYERVMRALRGDNRVLPPILLELSRAQLETGANEASIETLDRALRTAGRQAGIRAEIYEQMRTAYRRTDRLPELAERLRGEGRGGYEGSALLAQIEDELGNDEAALAAYRRALRVRSRDIDARRSIIQILMRSGRLDDVVAEYRALIRSAPREPRFVIELAQHLMQTDAREEALRLVREAGRRHARDSGLHARLAQLYTRWGEEELANREIEILVRIDPGDPAHVIALGSQQFAAGDRTAAMATWRRVLEAGSDRARGHATLAGILADHDLLPQAIEHYRRAVELDADELTHVRGLATTLERHHQNEAAETQWTRVLELATEDRLARREARERIVGIWSRTRRLEEQIRALEIRFRSEPPDADAGRLLAEAHRRRGPQHQAEAERVLARIVEADHSDVESLLALERLRRHRGDLAGAIEVLGRLRDADPQRASRYLQQMAEHSLALYRDEEAVRYSAEAVERNPEDASAHRRLGDLYRARQDTDHAVQSYRRALALNDRLHPVYFELAELYLARGETEEADRLYRQVLRITPDDDLVSRAARASIQLNLGAGTLRILERDLLPLSLGHPERPIFRRMAVELYDAYAGPLARRARQGGPGAAEAREELRSLGSRAIKPLLEALADSDPAQRRVALDILGDLGNPNAAAPLLAVAENPSIDLRERMEALRAAGTVASPAHVARFSGLARGPDARLRGLASWALVRIGGRDARRVSAGLRTATDPVVRAYATMGVALDPARGTAAGLVRSLETDGQEDVVLATTWALGRAGDESHAEALAQVLRGRGGPAAIVAADALGELGGELARRTLVAALFDPDPALRGAAATALRRMFGPPIEAHAADLPAPFAFELVRDYVPRMVARRPASPPVEDLQVLGADLEAAASVALRGPVEHVLAALAVLGGGGETLALGSLTGDVSTWPEAAVDHARAALARLAEQLMDELIEASAHEDAAVRVAAVQILVHHARPDADAAVAAALAQPPISAQRAALEALARTQRRPSPELSARLAQTLRGHRDWSMRTRAANALAGTDSAEARAALRFALSSDAYAFVREAAALALGVEATPEDLVALRRARDSDSEPRVRESSNRALH